MARLKSLREHGFNTDRRTYVIAEIGINHGGDLDTAKRLIGSAARTGADAVKFQTYITEKRVPEGNQTIFDILKKCELPFEVFGELKDHAASKGVDFFSTPFDRESVECLKSIGTDLYKVASFDIVNHELLREISATRKPVIISAGMADHDEVKDACDILKKGTDNITILHCVSAYPLAEAEADLATIYALQDAFDCVIGYSDHTAGIRVPLYAVAAGAQVVEKHFRVDENMDCVDAPVSITEEQMRRFVSEVRTIEKIFGEGRLGLREIEQPIMGMRRPSK